LTERESQHRSEGAATSADPEEPVTTWEPERSSDEPEPDQDGAERAAEEGEEVEEEPRSRVPALFQGRVGLTLLMVILAVIATLSLLWIAGEQHYQSCVQQAVAKSGSADDALTRLVRAQTLNKCSRSPF
jgi:hypothetical protein